jgi:hypothetical protein
MIVKANGYGRCVIVCSVRAEHGIDREPADAGKKTERRGKRVAVPPEREARGHHLRHAVARPERRKHTEQRKAD